MVFPAAAAAKLLQSCLTLCDPIDGSPPGSPILGILQARTLEWVAISLSNAWKWKVKVKSVSHVRLCDSMDCSPPGSSTHGSFQARVLEWGAIAFSSGFPYFLQLRSKFGNKEFMIWATVSSWPCFCWLNRASPSLAAKNIIHLILVLTIWWHPCVEPFLVLLEDGVCYDQCISLCPASFCISRPNLPVTPGISLLSTFAFQSPMLKGSLFWLLVLEVL